MKQEKFKVVEHIRIFIKAILTNLNNFPKKEYELKEKIKMNSYDILELAYEANSTELIELKINLINKILAKVKLIDFLLDLSVDMELLTKKKYIKLANRLSDIEKYSRGWMEQSKNSLTILKEKEYDVSQENTVVIRGKRIEGRLRKDKEPDKIILSEKSKENLNILS